jgi:hypothetical protein
MNIKIEVRGSDGVLTALSEYRSYDSAHAALEAMEDKYKECAFCNEPCDIDEVFCDTDCAIDAHMALEESIATCN